MSRVVLVLVVAVLLLGVGGIVFLGTYDMPPPTQKIEVEIPHERLQAP